MLLPQGLARSFGVTVAWRDCALELRRGEIEAISGENGSGKRAGKDRLRACTGLTVDVRVLVQDVEGVPASVIASCLPKPVQLGDMTSKSGE